MQIAEVFLVIVIFISIVGILGLIIYNKFEELTIYINEAELNIDETLRKKFDIMNRLVNVINGNVDKETDLFNDFVKLKGKKMPNHEFDKKLVEASIAFYEAGEKFKNLKEIKNYNKMIKDLENNEESLIAAKKYYNDNITKYNRLVKVFPSNIIALLNKHSAKPFFDDKSIYDEVYNDFQI